MKRDSATPASVPGKFLAQFLGHSRIRERAVERVSEAMERQSAHRSRLCVAVHERIVAIPMGFEREEQPKTILGNLALGSKEVFASESSRIQQDFSARGMGRSTGALALVAQACEQQITERVLKVPSEI